MLLSQAEVLFAGDMPLEQLLDWCRSSPLVLQVHDRTAVPDPPEFPIAQDEGAEGAQAEDEGYVCAQARVPLLDLARGSTRRAFTAPLLPYSTIRGAASLDWAKRPGNYVEVCHGC